MKYLQYSYFCIIISKSNKWKRIEVVVTSRTRNAVDRKVT